MDIDYNWSRSIIERLCVQSCRRIWAHTMMYGAPLRSFPEDFFFSLYGTNMHWRGYVFIVVYINPYKRIKQRQYFIYVLVFLYVLISNLLLWRLYHYLYFFLFVYFEIYLSIYMCLIFSPIIYGRVAQNEGSPCRDS